MFGRRFYRVSYCGRRIAAVRPSGPESDVDLGLGWRREREKKMKREREREREREKKTEWSFFAFLSVDCVGHRLNFCRPAERALEFLLFQNAVFHRLVDIPRICWARNEVRWPAQHKMKIHKKKTSKEKGKPNALALVIENGARPAKKKQSAIFRSNGDNFEAHRRAPHVVRRRRGKT